MSKRSNRDNDEGSNWIINFDKIEDSTRKNYFSALPQDEQLRDYFGEAFSINNPKGSVGGDGFWLHKHEKNIYLALFTCVGEGHLASMMIRIYMNALKKMVEGYSIDFPGSILQFLHREVLARFKNKNNILLNTNANVGIVKLDTETRALEFAGANMDLIQISDDGVRITKGEKHQVGEETEQRLSYTSNSIVKGDESNFYLVSSGVFNLVGGPEFKKLDIRTLTRFLEVNYLDTMHQQKQQLSDFLSSWTGANRQNDDIMVIGFKA